MGKFLDSFGDKDYKEIVTKTEIAEAVELLGCWFVDKQRDLAKGSKFLSYYLNYKNVIITWKKKLIVDIKPWWLSYASGWSRGDIEI